MIYENNDGDLVDLPVSEIKGEKTLQDGSTRFKFIGGPFHDMIFRVYPPYETVMWPDGTTYDLSPPLNLKRSKKWCYVHRVGSGA